MKSMRVAIVGASGYSGEELLRLLLRHPHVEIACVTSRQYAGKPLTEVHRQFEGWPKAKGVIFSGSEISEITASGAEVVFLALPHGLAAEFAAPLIKAGLVVIDLSADFRVADVSVVEEFSGQQHPAPELLKDAVYGMPELHRDQIRSAKLVASPGCYPTSIILPLVPLLRAGIISPERIVVNSMSGVSGAGRKADVSLLYAECNEDARAYSLPKHRHLMEIEQELSFAHGAQVNIAFHPHLIPVNRGILTTIHAELKAGYSQVEATFEDAYGKEPFVRLLGDGLFPELKQVVRSNFLDIAWRHDKRTNSVVLLSAEDNLVKGAAGQAIHSLNLIANWPEKSGLI